MNSSRVAAAAPADPVLQDDEIRFGRPAGGWRLQLYTIVFRSDTHAGKLFDCVVIAAILLSVAAVIIDSVESVGRRHAALLNTAEWVFTILFTIEYVARLVC